VPDPETHAGAAANEHKDLREWSHAKPSQTP
jgi:hypothetical protein